MQLESNSINPKVTHVQCVISNCEKYDEGKFMLVWANKRGRLPEEVRFELRSNAVFLKLCRRARYFSLVQFPTHWNQYVVLLCVAVWNSTPCATGDLSMTSPHSLVPCSVRGVQWPCALRHQQHQTAIQVFLFLFLFFKHFSQFLCFVMDPVGSN